MEFAAAGGVFLLALFTGAVSWAICPVLLENQEGQEERAGKTAFSWSALFSKQAGRQWLLAAAIAMPCAAASFAACYRGEGMLGLVRQAIVSLLLLSAMVLDYKTHCIPNFLVLGGLGTGAVLLVLEFIFSRDTFLDTLIMSGVGLLFCLVLFYLLARLTREGIGMGDVKLVAATGWLLGLSSTLAVVLIAMLLCALVAAVLLITKKKSKNDRISFGPFLFFGYMLLLLLRNL